MNIIKNLMDVDKSIKEKFKIPTLNLLFIVCLYLWYTIDKFNTYNLFDFVPENWITFIFASFNKIYSNFGYLFIFAIFFTVITQIVHHKTKYYIFLPKSKELKDGTQESWNILAAQNDIISIIGQIGTNMFIIYFSASVLFFEPTSKYNMLKVMEEVKGFNIYTLLLCVNTIITFWYIIKKFYIIHLPSSNLSLDDRQFSYCKVIARTENVGKHSSLYLCCHYRNSQDYIVLIKQSVQQDNDTKTRYDIIFSTLNFDEAKYKYENYDFPKYDEGKLGL
ncbi:hypothetical protein RZE82_03460 [Mollicutes bacterium LVI A0039]|nr:hypothetical protein RZE82_03460 [Mollicutes bacterium LVI A0039]